jgi:hypothetical protein
MRFYEAFLRVIAANIFFYFLRINTGAVEDVFEVVYKARKKFLSL